MGETDLFDVRVTQVTWCSPGVLAFTLAAVDGHALPGYQPGAHVSVHLPVSGKPDRVRAYSLVNTDPGNDPSTPQRCYRIAVRRDDAGTGGSLHLHESVRPGDVLRISPPKNAFALGETEGVILLAGGIGVTPILTMAAALQRQGLPFTFHYAARSRDEAVFLEELRQLCGERLNLHIDEEAGRHLDLGSVLPAGPARPVYVCGPKPMIDAAVRHAATLGWPADSVKFELFGADIANQNQAGYEVVLQFSDKSVFVRPGQALLDVLIDEDVDLPYDCRAGFCGLCRVKVLEGEVNHNDTCLTDADRTQRRYMQACVSHAACSRLVLDL
ncbi:MULTISPECIES: PDR/VanB family oxidoreductase [unclassified Bordetella]|uniref:PDR/VanB family oxidoreductase n=1 Tax=unclassified Bordetella TaxID=2630031 RepID=UPI00132608D9|nr:MULTISPECIES: PDR/VanB family oxidoreductase [unclassified Bordetella]MVW70379.1 2Fe-2S iron-sulfur cluster binding domain-containing protein [Bordetella sp. 15P40C-2]MVW78153.1 2Fe-2S iron-sulfur cluster binding domain-containing protein [Bordetella sp. 02P26C-1]